MIKNNQPGGYGDEQKSVPTGKSTPTPWPTSKSWNSNIQLSDESQNELSSYIENGLLALEEALQDYITANSMRREIKSTRA